ncbi:MAG: hypothetical protein H0W44_05145 [Gammaproteobacteria bacterium]|nr:hypothetical protein [Gammaproteobacteria bacterium]
MRALLLGCLLIVAGFIAQIVLIVVKLAGATDISWWAVMSPLLCALVLYFILRIVGIMSGRLLLGRMAVAMSQNFQKNRSRARTNINDARVIEGEVLSKDETR